MSCAKATLGYLFEEWSGPPARNPASQCLHPCWSLESLPPCEEVSQGPRVSVGAALPWSGMEQITELPSQGELTDSTDTSRFSVCHALFSSCFLFC